MFNTMTVTLLERTKEIGIMRTIGASPQDVKNLFISESIVVGFLGGVSGIVMGVVLGVTVNVFLKYSRRAVRWTSGGTVLVPANVLTIYCHFLSCGWVSNWSISS
jgi:ABC-type antimicrobial peptide transport system permease subunit